MWKCGQPKRFQSCLPASSQQTRNRQQRKAPCNRTLHSAQQQCLTRRLGGRPRSITACLQQQQRQEQQLLLTKRDVC